MIVDLFKGVTDVKLILASIDKIPGVEITNVITLAVPYLKNITDGGHRAIILRVIHAAPEKRKSFDIISKLIAINNEIIPNMTIFSVIYKVCLDAFTRTSH